MAGQRARPRATAAAATRRPAVRRPAGVAPSTRWAPTANARSSAAARRAAQRPQLVAAAAWPAVPRVGDGAAVDDTLLEILGSAPHLLGLRVRSIGSESLVSNLGKIFGIDVSTTNQQAHDELISTLWLQLGFGEVGLKGTLGKTTRPLGLPLVDDDPQHGDKAFLGALLHDQPRTVTSVLQALLELCHQRERKAVDDAAPGESVREVLDIGGARRGRRWPTRSPAASSRPRRATASIRSPARRGRRDRREVRGVRAQRPGRAPAAARDPHQPGRGRRRCPSYLQGWPSGKRSSALGAWFRARARLAEFRDAAMTLVEAPIQQRAIAVSETLDCASHRYDAWVTSLPTRRIAQQRAANPTGVLLGAYGWVENLEPEVATSRAGGYLHAPSLAHAATAGVLRSGYLTHNPDAAGSAALAIDLSSARVRRALELLDGVRQGQPLGALLGYLIERRLHEERLDVYTLSLRSLAPAAAGRLVGRADALPAQAQEAIAATGVVDGIRLLQLSHTDIWNKLSSRRRTTRT